MILVQPQLRLYREMICFLDKMSSVVQVRSISSRVSAIILGRVIVPTFVLSSTTPPAWTAMIIHTSGMTDCTFTPSVNHSKTIYFCLISSLSLSLLDSFESQSERHYRRLVQPDGTEALACSGSRPRESGYLQLHTQPRPGAVSCQSESKGPYSPRRPLRVLVGHREESGYTEGTSLQPNTFLPHHINMDDARRTQQSVTRTDFLPASFLQGSEALPKLAFCAPRDTGFTRDTQKPLTSSVSFQGNSSEESRQTDRSPAVRWSIGPMCSSGFILNAPNITSLSHTPASPQHFITHYQSKFCDRASVEQVRADWMTGGVQMHRQSGYSERDSSRSHCLPIG
ncbi:protein phosphatase 1 regulatory subunit 32 isoform X2 [Triplophysa rosa]|uniref:protein phosphatase 1 regulatory subunit 32 isoform X2 n=1 Tax=Triplophysa rosa TaxID=992332 RepID=UPI002545DC01|nr:protein phosphatase 1 regulatory subunit 32 isoform X2 [Triplophysa rosa]